MDNTTTTTTPCDGTWILHPDLAEGTVELSRCSGCGEALAVYRGRGYFFPPGTDERTILTTIWTAVGR